MPSTLSLAKVLKPRAGWYRGDFHAHTNFSDGYHPPSELVEVARAEGLDFFAITDHNTVDAYPKFGNVPDILIIPGIEVTMENGHYNTFGIEGELDWLPNVCVWPAPLPHMTGQYNTSTQLMQRTAGQGLLNSINHPFLSPWAWLDYGTDLRYVHCLEICNDPNWPDNAQANPQTVDLWSQWLHAGYRITAIGGTDYHHPQLIPGYNEPQSLSLPSTYVYAEELSGAAILTGVRRRRVYVSLGPQVSLQVRSNGTTYGIGADMGQLDGVIEITGNVSYEESSALVQLVKNGHILDEVRLEDRQTSLHYSDEATSVLSAWYRLDVLDQDGRILAVTNPIFVGPQRKPTSQTFGAFLNSTTETNVIK
jgi:hypothetical protein